MVRSRNIILFNIGMEYIELEYKRDKSTAMSLRDMELFNCFVLGD